MAPLNKAAETLLFSAVVHLGGLQFDGVDAFSPLNPFVAGRRHFATAVTATLATDVDMDMSHNETSHRPEFIRLAPLPSSKKETPSRRKFKDDYYFNQALNQLAEQAGDFRQPVVRRAAAAEDMWKDFCSAPDRNWRPDVISFNTVLKAWTRAGAVLVDQHSHLSTPEHLLDPDIHIFSARDCALRAQELLEKQENDDVEQDADNDGTSSSCPDVTSYNTVMDAWAKSRTPESVQHVQDLMKRMMKRKLQPNRITFTALMESYAYSKREDRLDEIGKIWNRMHMQSRSDPTVAPNAQSLTILLHAYSRMAAQMISDGGEEAAKLKDLSDQAMVFLRNQEERYEETHDPKDQPEVMTYTTAMDVLSKVGTPASAHQAEHLWQKIKMLKHEPGQINANVRPTIYTYTTLISSWSRVTGIVPEAVNRITELIDELWENDYVYKNSRPFTAALRGYARSRFPLAEEPNKAVLALNTVKALRDKAKETPSLLPGHSVYHAAIDCCSKVLSSHQLQSHLTIEGSTVQCETTALKIAFALLRTMQVDNVEPTNETYCKLLMCTRNLLPPGEERTRVAESVYLKAQQAGFADKRVHVLLQQTVEATWWHDFCQAENLVNDRGRVDWRKIPHAWQKNAF